MEPLIHILHLEDDAADAKLVQGILESAGMACQITCVQTGEEFGAELRQGRYDVILADYRLPSYDGMSALRLVQEMGIDVPFIFVSGVMAEDAAIEGLTEGATDYVLKNKLSRLVPVVKRALHDAENQRDRLQAEKALREREAKYRAAVETVCDGFCITDMAGRFLEFNDAYAGLLGFSREELLSMTVPEIEAQSSPAEIAATIEKVRREGHAAFETKHRSKDNRVWPAEVNLAYWPIADGRMFVFVRDITERKQAEEALRESEERLRLLGDNLPESAVYQYVHEPGGSVRFLYISAGIEQLNGVNVQDVLNDAGTLHRQILPEYYERLVEAGARSVRELSDFEMEVQMRRPDGQIRWMQLHSRPRQMPDGRTVWDGVQTDITERKWAEEALREAQRDLNRAQAVARTGSWRLDLRRNELLWSEETYRMFEIAPDTPLTYEAFLSIVHPEDREFVDREWTAALGGKPYDIEHRIVVGDKVKWVRERAELDFDPQGALLSGFGTVQDITERKQSEEALRESEERFRLAFENANIGMALVGIDGRYLRVNDAMSKMFGYHREELEKMGVRDLTYPDDLQLSRYFRLQTLRGEIGNAQFEKRKVHRNGTIVWVQIASSLVRDSQDKPLYFISQVQDITARKKAEEELRRVLAGLEQRVQERTVELQHERQRLFSLLEELPGYVVLMDPNFKFTFVNRFFRKRFGEPGGRLCYEILRGRCDPCENCPMIHVFATKKEHEMEWRSPAGLTYHLFAYPFEDVEGHPLVLELGIDVTARKQAEEMVRRRANQQAAVAKLGQMAIAGADLSGLLNDAVTSASKNLGVEYCKVLELLPKGNALLLRAGVGWKPGLVGRAEVDAGVNSQAGYTLASASPVIVEDLARETRFSGSPLLHEHGVVSGLSVIIQGKERPFGVLGAHTKRKQTFSQDDVNFLQSIANMLAEVIEGKRVEAELRRSEQNLRSLTFRLFTLQEAERKQVSQELHEDLAQTLQALTLQASFMKSRSKDDQQHLFREFEESRDLLQAAVKSVRRLSQELTPSILQDFGLFSALKYLINKFCEDNNMEECQIDLDEEINLFSPKVQINIYRIFEEALLNIEQHAEASHIFISGKIQDNTISFIVEDNGSGFNVDDILTVETIENKFGLHAIEQRIKMLGGSFHIQSQKGKGTKITFSIPIGL